MNIYEFIIDCNVLSSDGDNKGVIKTGTKVQLISCSQFTTYNEYPSDTHRTLIPCVTLKELNSNNNFKYDFIVPTINFILSTKKI